MLAGLLEFCACGHTRDRHTTTGRCCHVNTADQRRGWPAAPCACRRFQSDPRLHDGEDFAGKVLRQVVQSQAIPCEPIEWETALAELVEQLWLISSGYDSRSHIRFRVYAYTGLYQDAIDHFRKHRGRNGQHRVYDPRNSVSAFGGSADRSLDGDPGAAGLDGRASRDPGDDPDNWLADGGGLLEVGDRPPARPGGGGGDAARNGHAGLDGRAGAEPSRRAGRAVAGTDPRARTAGAART